MTVSMVVALLALTGCNNHADRDRAAVSEVYEAPAQMRDATVVWSAESGIDLFSPESTLVRASHEASAIASLVGFNYTYPGFSEASTVKVGGKDRSLEDETGRGPFVGTIHSRIMAITPTTSGFDSLTCVLSVGLDELRDGKYSPSKYVAHGHGSPIRTHYTRTAQPSAPTPATTNPIPDPDRLHWQAPTGNEFNGWTFEGIFERDREAVEDLCTAWAQSIFPNAPEIIAQDAYARDSPPPSQPADPGWPSAQR